MILEEVLEWIQNADEETSCLIRDAVIRRREELMDGGEVFYDELSKERVDYYNGLRHDYERYLEEEQ